ncbi:Iwr1 domain-containing protein [Mycena indigotica]|uniref:Iwr1 domain-containing protein n=1 Tax=Mycena indigotica TaxID=2126181 RepID=A0A8H6SH45_9AGAR|nr:Iwr1 domain-containing protein [Mycena indigotica]KAF7299361.1 Iwr1 domain-containing protein [Mycena indigotica]
MADFIPENGLNTSAWGAPISPLPQSSSRPASLHDRPQNLSHTLRPHSRVDPNAFPSSRFGGGLSSSHNSERIPAPLSVLVQGTKVSLPHYHDECRILGSSVRYSLTDWRKREASQALQDPVAVQRYFLTDYDVKEVFDMEGRLVSTARGKGYPEMLSML